MSDQGGEQDPLRSQETAVGHQVVGGAGDPATENTEVFFSRDQPQQQPSVPTPPTPPTPSNEPPSGGSSPASADRIAADQEDSFAEKPHLYVIGAFAGAFVVAQILKRITGGGD
jgi:hypothetical protein